MKLAPLALCPLLALPSIAHAQEGRESWKPDTHRSGAGAEIFLWDTDAFGTNLPIIGFANIGFAEDLFIDVQVPFNTSFNGPDTFGLEETTRAAIGNPAVAFRYAPTMGDDVVVRWFVGGGLVFPVGTINDDPDFLFALGSGFLTTTLYDGYLWALDALPMFATGGVDIRPVEWVSIQTELKIIPWIALDDRNDSELYIQNRFGAEFRHPEIGIGGGLNFLLVADVTDDGLGRDDRAQVAMEPYFAYTNERFFTRLGLRQALDEPLGFAFDDGRVVSGHLTVGGSWD